MPYVSIILPFHNAIHYLAQAVNSILADKKFDGELLLIDDGSTDTSSTVADQSSVHDPRIRVLRCGRQGLVNALNLGLEEASAPLVARMDADDIAHPDRIAHQCAFLARHPEVHLVSCLVRPFGESITQGTMRYISWVNESIDHESIIRDLYVESPLPHPSVMYRKDAILSLGGYRDYDGPEDYDLWLRMASAGCRFAKVPEILLDWRIHNDSYSRKDRRYRRQAFYRRKSMYAAERLGSEELAVGKRLRIWGAGTNGRRLASYLNSRGHLVEAFVDVDPRLIGATRLKTPVFSPTIIGKGDNDHHYLCMVGNWGARDKIRQVFRAKGKVEGVDFTIL
ncbi:MAG: glycosyltransferase [Chitinivibrionales bacterium]|nr:glycosyltransferase [Chitinivibrionales bacterium]MBD3358603.1 glycosyltransferase [Chitinivibrionales bacterium]